ncbi:Pentatricopeptide repeat-containing protein, chloroplastic [Vitis vinifera]|uniref:Pentatricopeptide repeat-containing protein, chloroplastic n=1 Tax=Vitis vinifera TaxID=29760 RepID=A0A438CFQ4_VITVI|nr:Pentatricopeptide repeat-containing protein, chloroplastic [Vitis vinifera]
MKPMLDQGSLVAAIKRCTRVGDLKAIQAHMATWHTPIAYSHVPTIKNLFMWNTIIRGYSISDSPISAIALYRDMFLCGISPNSYTFGFVLNACCKLLRLCEGQELHSQIAVEALKLFREMQAENVSSDAFTLASVVGVCGDLGALDLGKWFTLT